MKNNGYLNVNAWNYFEQKNKTLKNQRDEVKNVLTEIDDKLNSSTMFIENYKFDGTEFPIKGLYYLFNVTVI